MVRPLWAVNSALLGVLLLSTILMIMTGGGVPAPESIIPKKVKVDRSLDPVKTVDITQVYQNDLFGTYHGVEPEVHKPDLVKPIPEAPPPERVQPPEPPEPHFLEPLPLDLVGVLTVNDGSGNAAIIGDEKEKLEKTYYVGDTIEDAQLVRIFNDRVLLIRSNGQQEELHLWEGASDEQAKSEQTWDLIIKKVSHNEYSVDRIKFAEKVENLAKFIDLLDLITAYKDGKNIGCRICQIDENSLGEALGLAAGDVISEINGIKPTTIQNRMKIYHDVIKQDGAGIL